MSNNATKHGAFLYYLDGKWDKWYVFKKLARLKTKLARKEQKLNEEDLL
ncbi:MAG: hypothetical protein QQN63_00180 [Nitrosopumilus sp.]